MTSDIGNQRRTATVSVLFCDLVASTERQQLLGDDAADEFRRVLFATLHATAADAHGEVVKTTGDGMMVVFRHSAADAVACAAGVHTAVEALDVEPTACMRVGVSAGEAAFDDDDWFGTPVVEAARLCASADVGQTLVTDVVRVLVGSRGIHELRPAGSITLKGMSTPIAVADVVRDPGPAPALPQLPNARRRARRLTPGLAVLAVLAIVTSAIAFRASIAKPEVADALVYTPRVEAEQCSSSVRAAARNASCGAVVVPENRARPDGRWIRVKFKRYPARHAHATSDPVIEIATALDAAEIVDDPAQSPVRDAADLIVFGGRGLGSSSPALTCPEFTALGPDILRNAPSDPPTIARGSAALRACHDRLLARGIALDHYTVLDEADDVVDLARALGLRRANLQGVWDGTRVALEVARQAPGLVRSLLLVDPEVPRSSFMTDPDTSLSAAFERYVKLCERDQRCQAAYPHLAGAFRSDVAEQAEHPQVVTPNDLISGVLRVTVAQPPVFLDGNRVAQGLAAALTSSLRNMPLLAAGIQHPDAPLSASLALAQNFPLVLKDFPWGGFLSRMCSYEVHTRSAGAAIAATTRAEFAGYDDVAFRWTCAAWEVPEVARLAFAPVGSDAPTLVVEQQLDPRWDPDAASELRAGLTHMSVLSFATLPGGALPGDFPACYHVLRRRFIRDPNAKLDTPACAKQTPRIDFVVPTP